MRFASNSIYRHVAWPSPDLFEEVWSTADHLRQKLVDVDLHAIGLSEYNQRYVNDHYTKWNEWSLNALILAGLLEQSREPREGLCLLDYGAGSGSICLLARALGIGTVIYSDIYDVSCRDALTLASHLGLEASHYVVGELEDVVSYMIEHDLECDLLASHNCIEHIYDIEEFLSRLGELPGTRMEFWLSTTANPARRKNRRLIESAAQRLETQGAEDKWGHKKRDTMRPYLEIRREMIASLLAGGEQPEIDELAAKTRGLREDDIAEVVAQFRQTGLMPPDPRNRNTCDPYTGNWAERLMDPNDLVRILESGGLDARVLPLPWPGDDKSRLKGYVKNLANLAITLAPGAGLRFAAGYVLLGQGSSPSAKPA